MISIERACLAILSAIIITAFTVAWINGPYLEPATTCAQGIGPVGATGSGETKR